MNGGLEGSLTEPPAQGSVLKVLRCRSTQGAFYSEGSQGRGNAALAGALTRYSTRGVISPDSLHLDGSRFPIYPSQVFKRMANACNLGMR